MISCLKNVVKTYTSKSHTEILTWCKMGSLRLSPWEGLSALLTRVIGNPLLGTIRGRQCGVCDLVLWLFTRGCTVQTLSLDTRFFPGFLRSGLERWVFTNSPTPSLPPGLSGNPSLPNHSPSISKEGEFGTPQYHWTSCQCPPGRGDPSCPEPNLEEIFPRRKQDCVFICACVCVKATRLEH